MNEYHLIASTGKGRYLASSGNGHFETSQPRLAARFAGRRELERGVAEARAEITLAKTITPCLVMDGKVFRLAEIKEATHA